MGLLPGCGDAAALGELTRAARDSSPALQAAAGRALAEWPDAAAWESLVSFADKTSSEALRNLALRGLVRIAGDENARPDSKTGRSVMNNCSEGCAPTRNGG